jgi:hypothetical protein
VSAQISIAFWCVLGDGEGPFRRHLGVRRQKIVGKAGHFVVKGVDDLGSDMDANIAAKASSCCEAFLTA